MNSWETRSEKQLNSEWKESMKIVGKQLRGEQEVIGEPL